jgi:4,5-dihydroxyphthalate decarboxylase
MSLLKLSIATTDYDHFRDLRMGFVQAEGIDLNWLNLGHHECFARFTANREFDISELSFAKFSTQVTRPDSDIIGLPVVCSRLFRFSSFYVNRKSGIRTVKDLIGKKVDTSLLFKSLYDKEFKIRSLKPNAFYVLCFDSDFNDL